MTYSKALYKAQKKYDANNCYRVGIKLNRKTDIDIIEELEKTENVQAFIKMALRKYIWGFPDQAPAPENPDFPESSTT